MATEINSGVQSAVQNAKKKKGQSEDWPFFLIQLVGAAGFELAVHHRPYAESCAAGTESASALLYEYADEKRQAWHQLGDYLTQLLQPTPNVLSFQLSAYSMPTVTSTYVPEVALKHAMDFD